MRCRRPLATFAALVLLLLVVTAGGQRSLATAAGTAVEPTAASWQTWLLAAADQLRPPPPPDAAATAAELSQLHSLVDQRDAAALDRLHYWDAGAPGYRWDQILGAELAKHGQAGALTTRATALLQVGIYDATVAAWDAKYAYNRPRPAEVDSTLTTVLPSVASPAYPAEHAVVAAVAADVLAYLFPDDADVLHGQAQEAAQSRLLAGLQYPSDVSAGEQLGHQVAALVVDHAMHDGSQVPVTRTFPSGVPGQWSLAGYADGTKPVGVNLGSYTTWVLHAGSQLRPPPPPSVGSAEQAADLTAVTSWARTFASNAAAFFWQSQQGTTTYWMELADQKIFEQRWEDDPPRAARVQALLAVAGYDAQVACFDAKYTYLRPRPFQAEPTFTPLFPTPPHPSYPAAHGCGSGASAAVLAYLFPRDADFFTARATEAGMARLWGGIHFPTDIQTGLALGRAVAALVIAHAEADGAP